MFCMQALIDSNLKDKKCITIIIFDEFNGEVLLFYRLQIVREYMIRTPETVGNC